MRCQVEVTPLMDFTGERAEPCGAWSVGQCADCSTHVCLEHGQLCACGKILCETCRVSHQADCESFKLSEFDRINKHRERTAAC